MSLPDNRLSLALDFHRQGDLGRADALYADIVRSSPLNADAWHLWGCLAQQVGRSDDAIARIERAIALESRIALFHASLAGVFAGREQWDRARVCYERSIALDRSDADTHLSLGFALIRLNRLDDAIAAHRAALTIDPSNAEAQFVLGCLLSELGRNDAAIAAFSAAVALRPDHAVAHDNLGQLWSAAGDHERAATAFQLAIAHAPSAAAPRRNLANLLLRLGYFDDAERCLADALALQPDDVDSRFALASLRHDQGRFALAAADFARIYQQHPDRLSALSRRIVAMQHVCDWRDLEPLAQSLIDALDARDVVPPGDAVSPFAFITLPVQTSPAQQLRVARRWCEIQFPVTPRPPLRRITPGDKIVVGYLSADFHAHATAALVAELFESHDRDRFVIFGYSIGPDDSSPIRRRLEMSFDRFVDLAPLPHAQAARRIADDRVDILVDLKGHTQNARPSILALRPAPIQIGYLGYPGTSGSAFLDFVLVDDFIAPPEARPYFSETCLVLPGCYQINDRQRPLSATVPTRRELGLPDGAIVFAAFNNPYKITPAAFDSWMRLLRAVPGSVLWLFDPTGRVAENLRNEASRRGVEPGRLIFAPPMPLAEHLARHAAADLFLDTFPVTAHTTGSDALWAGLPMVTRVGESFISRVSGSLLHAVGLPELIAADWREYEAIALDLARDADKRKAIRDHLRQARDTSPLFDSRATTRSIESAYLDAVAQLLALR